MQVTATAPIREHEKPMSWARAMLIAVGFFFAAAILLGQFPSYVFTISTLSTLATLEQSFLDFGLLAVGFGLLALEIALLYDPKPIIPGLQVLFAGAGTVLGLVGLFFVYQVSTGVGSSDVFGQPGWNELVPNAPHSYLFNPGWFQQGAIDISAVGMIGILIGGGMLGFAVLNPLVLSGRLVGPLRDVLVRFSLGLAIVIAAIWLGVYTFFPQSFEVRGINNQGKFGLVPSPAGNALLFIALMLIIFALMVWLLPVMVARRQEFMPAVYLHGVVGLLGNVGIPFLLIWAVVYPVVNAIHMADTNEFWVQCSQKTYIPGSCTFTPFTGYIITAVVYGTVFGLFILGLYFWSTRRNTVVLGGTVGLVWVGLAATLIHVNDPAQTPFGLIIAIGIALVAFVYTWSTQREFAPTYAQQLGCTGQWLMLGTLMLIFIFGFAFFSMPSFFEVEALAMFYIPGQGNLHDAFWVFLLMGGLAAFQFTLLVRGRRIPMGNIRKFALWTMLFAVLCEITGAIIGFHSDVLTGGVNVMEGSDALVVTGLIFELVGVLASLLGAARARGRLVSGWSVVIVVAALIGIAEAMVAYNLPSPYPELVIFGFIFASVGAFAYVAAGPELVDPYAAALNGNGNGTYVTGR